VINPRLLDQRITLQQRVAGRDALGQATSVWADVATVWARAEPLRGREYLAAEQAQSEVSVRFRIRWREGVTSGMRVLWRGQPHDIDGAIDVNGAKSELQLMCIAGVRDGR